MTEEIEEKYKFVYICHPVKGDCKVSYEENILDIKKTCRNICIEEKGIIPVTPYLSFLQYLNDNNKEERALGLKYDLEFIKMVSLVPDSELWVYGHKISKNMEKEIRLSLHLKLPVYTKNENLFGKLEKIIFSLK